MNEGNQSNYSINRQKCGALTPKQENTLQSVGIEKGLNPQLYRIKEREILLEYDTSNRW
jgi:hypothetical protein